MSAGEHPMAIAAMSAGIQTTSQQSMQTVGQHKHGGHRASLSDVDAQGSSVATAASSTGKIGSKIDLRA
jgi:hypothetical protein